MSSPVFTITATSSGGTARTSPARKRAAPTPPASATTRVRVGSGGIGRGSGGRSRCRLALGAHRAQLVLELRQAIADHRDLARLVLSHALGIADVVAERGLVRGDLLLDLRDPRVDRGELLVRDPGARVQLR